MFQGYIHISNHFLHKGDYVKISQHHPVKSNWLGQVLKEEDDEGFIDVLFPDGLVHGYEREDLLHKRDVTGLIAAPQDRIVLLIFSFSNGNNQYVCTDNNGQEISGRVIGGKDRIMKIPIEQCNPLLFSFENKHYCGYARTEKDGVTLICGMETRIELWEDKLK